MILRKFRLFAILAVLSGPSITAYSGSRHAGDDTPLSLAAALARTLRESPDLAIYQYEFRAAEARILQAGVKPNPALSFDIENATGTGSYKNGDQAENTLSLSQLIERGDKRPARIREAQATRTVVEWEYQVKRIEVLKVATLIFIDVLAAQRRLELAEEVLKVSNEAAASTEQRVGVGKASAVEAIRANVAVSTASIEVEQARRDIATARGNLAAQWGAKTADFRSVRGTLDQRQHLPSLESLRQRLLSNPDLTRWTAVREQRQALLNKEQTQARQDFTLHAGPRMEGKGADATFVAGLSIPLPINDRNQGNIAVARANLAKLTEEKRAGEARAFAALNEAFQKLAGAVREISILEGNVIPSAQEAEKQLSVGYAAGRFTQFEVLDARRTLNGARVQQLRSLADYQKARAEVDALTAQPAEFPRSWSAKTISPQGAQQIKK